MNVFFKKIGGFGKKIEKRKSNVLSIIFYVKMCADSKKNTNINQMYRFLAYMAKKRILKRNYKKNYIYFNKNNSFQDILLKTGIYTL